MADEFDPVLAGSDTGGGIDPSGFSLTGDAGGGGGLGGGFSLGVDKGFGGDPGSSYKDFASQFDFGGGGGGTGWDKFTSGLGRELTDNPIKSFAGLLGIGSTGLNIGNQFKLGSQLNTAQKNVTDAQAQARAAAAPAVAAGTANLQRGEAGKLQPAQEAQIQQAEQQAVADIRGRFASMGLGNSQQEQDAVNRVHEQFRAVRAQALQGEEQLGGELIGTGVNASLGGAQVAGQQEKLLADLIASANQSLGVLGGRSS